MDPSRSLPTGFPPTSCPPHCGQRAPSSLKSDHVLLCSKPPLVPFSESQFFQWCLRHMQSGPWPLRPPPLSPSLALHRLHILLTVPGAHQACSHLKDFAWSVPAAWNALPTDNHMASSLTSLLSLLKSHGSVRPPCPCLSSQSPFPGSPAWPPARITVSHTRSFTCLHRCLLSISFCPHASTAGIYKHLLNEWCFLLGNN